jgi:hypothetical protein
MSAVHMRIAATVLCAALGACATTAPSSPVPELPPGIFGVYQDNDLGALNQSSWAFAAPARTRGNPMEAARAVIAVEYLADELRANPRWVELSATSKLGMVHARQDIRRVLGIRPDVPSELVVDALLRFPAVLRAGDQVAFTQTLGPTVFTLPPSQTLRILSDLPYIASANQATVEASNEALPNGRR